MPPKNPSAARIAAARLMYDTPGVTLTSIATRLGMSLAVFAKRREAWGWPARAKLGQWPDVAVAPVAVGDTPGAAGDAPAVSGATVAIAASPDAASLAARLRTIILAELPRVEAALAAAPKNTAEGERRARIVASLVRSLAQAGQLQRDQHDALANEQNPEALDDLHDEFARRLAGLREDGSDAAGAGENSAA